MRYLLFFCFLILSSCFSGDTPIVEKADETNITTELQSVTNTSDIKAEVIDVLDSFYEGMNKFDSDVVNSLVTDNFKQESKEQGLDLDNIEQAYLKAKVDWVGYTIKEFKELSNSEVVVGYMVEQKNEGESESYTEYRDVDYYFLIKEKNGWLLNSSKSDFKL